MLVGTFFRVDTYVRLLVRSLDVVSFFCRRGFVNIDVDNYVKLFRFVVCCFSGERLDMYYFIIVIVIRV